MVDRRANAKLIVVATLFFMAISSLLYLISVLDLSDSATDALVLPLPPPPAVARVPMPIDPPHHAPVVATPRPAAVSPRVDPPCRIVRAEPKYCAARFIVAGLPHSAASAFVAMIEQHPEVKVEPGCFFSSEAAWKTGFNAYWATMRFPPGVAGGEFCPDYAAEFGSRIVGRIEAFMPATPVFVVYGDPVEQFERHAAALGMHPDVAWLTYGRHEMERARECVRAGVHVVVCLLRAQRTEKNMVIAGMHRTLFAQFGTLPFVAISEHELYDRHAGVAQLVFARLGVRALDVGPPKPLPPLVDRLAPEYRKVLIDFYNVN